MENKRKIIKSGKKDENGELCRRLNISLDEDKVILLIERSQHLKGGRFLGNTFY